MYVAIMTWNSGGIVLFNVNLFLDNYQFNRNIMKQSGIRIAHNLMLLIIRPEISYFGLKRRIISFNEAHELEYSLEIASRNGISKQIACYREEKMAFFDKPRQRPNICSKSDMCRIM